MIDAAQVAPNLWVGARPPCGRIPFDVLVLCATEHQPEHCYVGVPWIARVPFRDTSSPSMEDLVMIDSAARLVIDHLRAKRRVLVTCMMGLNRSALVAGLAMRTVYGMAPDDVIQQIRTRRSPEALFNERFVRLLRA